MLCSLTACVIVIKNVNVHLLILEKIRIKLQSWQCDLPQGVQPLSRGVLILEKHRHSIGSHLHWWPKVFHHYCNTLFLYFMKQFKECCIALAHVSINGCFGNLYDFSDVAGVLVIVVINNYAMPYKLEK